MRNRLRYRGASLTSPRRAPCGVSNLLELRTFEHERCEHERFWSLQNR